VEKWRSYRLFNVTTLFCSTLYFSQSQAKELFVHRVTYATETNVDHVVP